MCWWKRQTFNEVLFRRHSVTMIFIQYLVLVCSIRYYGIYMATASASEQHSISLSQYSNLYLNFDCSQFHYLDLQKHETWVKQTELVINYSMVTPGVPQMRPAMPWKPAISEQETVETWFKGGTNECTSGKDCDKFHPKTRPISLSKKYV